MSCLSSTLDLAVTRHTVVSVLFVRRPRLRIVGIMVPRLALSVEDVNKIRQVLQEEISQGLEEDGHRKPEFNPLPLPLAPVSYSKDGKTLNIAAQYRFRNVFSDDQTAEHIRDACMSLFSLCGTRGYLAQLNDAMALRLECSFERVQDLGETVGLAARLLGRLPRHAPPIAVDKGIYQGILNSHLVDADGEATWENLKASAFLDRNTIRLALYIATHTADSVCPSSPVILEHVNNIARLIEEAAASSRSEKDPGRRQQWFLLEAYLWTCWHRSVLMHLSADLQACLRIGTANNRYVALEFEGIHSIAGLSPAAEAPKYVCRWAYELVRTDRASVGLDLRQLCDLLAAYSEEVGLHEPRCCISESGSLVQCDGSSPYSCGRFRSMKVPDQSAHASSCSKKPQDCTVLRWQEDAYQSINGPRAVSIKHDGSDGYLSYCSASRKTMTISHVWSHGQGGSPDGTGFNSCLHRRYCKISRNHGFDSYWIDAACIPTVKALRSEAIGQINHLFKNSDMTLVCDRDIIELDVGSLSVAVKETLLAVLLVCDWNVRAWTFLEAMRGRANLHLLCKNDRVVSLRSLIEDVNTEGSLEIAAMFVTAQHLMPGNPFRQSGEIEAEYVQPEEAATLLSRRYTTKSGDELVIWSLLCGETVHKTGEEFWRSRRNIKLLVSSGTRQRGTVMGKVRTGFLVSSAPRIDAQRRGFGWAPSRPDLSYDLTDSGYRAFHAYDGRSTPMAYYDDEGLESDWLVHEFRNPGYTGKGLMRLMPSLRGTNSMLTSTLQQVALQKLHGFRWGAVLQAIDDKAAPLSVDKIAASTRGHLSNPNGHAVVLVGSQDRVNWVWIGVDEMNDDDLKTLQFDRKTINIV